MYNKNIFYVIYVLFLCLSARGENAFAVSFDCNQAKTAVEKSVCENEDRSKLDEVLAASYKRALQGAAIATTSHKDIDLWLQKAREKCGLDDVCFKNERDKKRLDVILTLKKNQRIWLKKDRNKCQNNACLKNVCQSRIESLDGFKYFSSFLLSASDQADKQSVAIEVLFLNLPDDAFYNGAESLGREERRDLVSNNESDVYLFDIRVKNKLRIINKYAFDSVFTVKRFVAETRVILCVHTSFSANETVECWHGKSKVDAFKPVLADAFFDQGSWKSVMSDDDKSQPEKTMIAGHAEEQTHSLHEFLQQYPVQFFFEAEGIGAAIRTEVNYYFKVDYVWQSQGQGTFVMRKTRRQELEK